MNRNQIRFLVFLFIFHPIWVAGEASDNNQSIRNPFQSLLLTSCNSAADYLKKWQLRGVLGWQDHHHGWILKPNGEWHKLFINKPILTDWRVSDIGLRRVNVRYEKPKMPCAIMVSTQVSWSLQENNLFNK